nr:immunoglobulin light chain junction region [Macaca mulatta]MOW69448.1 immunoglobulin light chain junction region [Macaca mulatta]MOW71999.1 immunoglobulin light chain junction region [Macaca mulatta]
DYFCQSADSSDNHWVF